MTTALSRQTSIHLPLAQTKTMLASKAIETIKIVVGDNKNRLNTCSVNPNSLKSGVFYAHEYHQALQSNGYTQDLNLLKTNGSFHHGLAPSTHFKKFPMPVTHLHPTGYIGGCFTLKENAIASEALNALGKGPSFIDCVATCQLAYYEAIKHLLGDLKFNFLFAFDSTTPLTIGNPDLCLNPLDMLVKDLPEEAPITGGQITQFKNIPYYEGKHLNGAHETFCTICCDDTDDHKTFTTLGLSPEGMTHEAIDNILMQEFNNPPIGMDLFTQEVAERILSNYSEEQLTLSENFCNLPPLNRHMFKTLGGGEIVFRAELNAERIRELANTTLRGARLLFNKWAKESGAE